MIGGASPGRGWEFFGAHPASYSMSTRVCFPGGKAAVAWSCPLPSNAEVKNVWNYTSIPPIHLHGVVLS
jgi:hypothetical protein